MVLKRVLQRLRFVTNDQVQLLACDGLISPAVTAADQHSPYVNFHLERNIVSTTGSPITSTQQSTYCPPTLITGTADMACTDYQVAFEVRASTVESDSYDEGYRLSAVVMAEGHFLGSATVDLQAVLHPGLGNDRLKNGVVEQLSLSDPEGRVGAEALKRQLQRQSRELASPSHTRQALGNPYGLLSLCVCFTSAVPMTLQRSLSLLPQQQQQQQRQWRLRRVQEVRQQQQQQQQQQ